MQVYDTALCFRTAARCALRALAARPRGKAPRGYTSTPRFTVGTKRPGFDTVLACATAAAATIRSHTAPLQHHPPPTCAVLRTVVGARHHPPCARARSGWPIGTGLMAGKTQARAAGAWLPPARTRHHASATLFQQARHSAPLQAHGAARRAGADGLAGPAARDQWRGKLAPARRAPAAHPRARGTMPAPPSSNRRGAALRCRRTAPPAVRAQTVWLAQQPGISGGESLRQHRQCFAARPTHADSPAGSPDAAIDARQGTSWICTVKS
jgi:hypothetical protein